MSGLSAQNADLIARTRAELDVTAVEPMEMAGQVGRLKWLAESLCTELEDAADPDGAGKRLVRRLAALNARLDAQADQALGEGTKA